MEDFYYILKGSDKVCKLGAFDNITLAMTDAEAKFGDKLQEVYGNECVWTAKDNQIFLRATEQ